MFYPIDPYALKLFYDYMIDDRIYEVKTAKEVIDQYKSGIADPSRYVAQLEQKIPVIKKLHFKYKKKIEYGKKISKMS
jgi:DNA repair ATPase RecN